MTKGHSATPSRYTPLTYPHDSSSRARLSPHVHMQARNAICLFISKPFTPHLPLPPPSQHPSRISSLLPLHSRSAYASTWQAYVVRESIDAVDALLLRGRRIRAFRVRVRVRVRVGVGLGVGIRAYVICESIDAVDALFRDTFRRCRTNAVTHGDSCARQLVRC